jgi:hypothetical protein
MHFIGCYSAVYGDGGSIWNPIGSEATCAGAIIIDGEMFEAPSFTGEIYKSFPTRSRGLINCRDAGANYVKNDTVYYSLNRKQAEYKGKDGVTVDLCGNAVSAYGTFPFAIGNGFYIDGGAVEVTGSWASINYNRDVNGTVLISAPPMIDGVPIQVLRDVSENHNEKDSYSYYHVKMWDATNNKWVDNNKPFTLKWFKISL